MTAMADIRAHGQPAISENRLIAALFLPTVPLFAALQGVQQVLQPAQVEAADAAQKVANLALITSLSSITSVLGLVLGGIMSDRIRTPWGRRNPWIVVMAFASAGLLVLVKNLGAIAILTVVYCALWFTLNFAQAAMSAVLPERVSPRRRGLASSVYGLAIPFGILVGVNIAGRIDADGAFWILALLLMAGSLSFAWLAPEKPMDFSITGSKASISVAGSVTGGLLSAFRHRDFTLAFTARALLFLAYFMANGFLFYLIKDRIPVAQLPQRNAGIAMSVLATLNMSAWIVSVPVAGWLADRSGRRKLTVSIASIGMAASLLPPAVDGSWTALVIFALVGGMSFGVYIAVDMALMSLVLPDQLSAGRDMAILTVASAGPQIVASPIAAALIYGLGYGAMFGASALLALLGGLLVLGIRSVK